MKLETVETDVLCVGGGIAGLMAAIRAREMGARAIVVEKGNTMRSGAGATGNDHFMTYLPEVHGPDIKPIIEEVQMSQSKGSNPAFVRKWVENTTDIVRLWDSWGIPMKYKGQWEFAGHAFPGRPLIWLKYAGLTQKPVLTREARKRGAQIMNRVMVLDLLGGDGAVHGAIGVDTRGERLIEIRAKAVMLGTGRCVRLYPGASPGWMSNLEHPFSNTGGGRAMAYRAGTELASMDIPRRWAGPKYFARCGKGTWVGLYRDPQGRPIGPFVSEPDKKYGDMTGDVYRTVFDDYARSGRGPVYMDCKGVSDEDYEYMVYWLEQEGNTALLDYMAQEGIDPRKNPVEFMTYGIALHGGLYCDERGETSTRGLYAAGDELLAGGISCAAVYGWICGENAAKYAKETDFSPAEKGEDRIEDKKRLIDEIRSRPVGAHWKEVNVAVQQIMQDYAGAIRSDTILDAGLTHLRRLREKARNVMVASNHHELMRCLEVLDLLDVGEMVLVSSKARKETRPGYQRPDYPFANPLLDRQLLFIKQVDQQPVTYWKEIGR